MTRAYLNLKERNDNGKDEQKNKRKLKLKQNEGIKT